MTQYDTGVYLGKFAPFHKGHEYCIDTALKECERVVVLVYWTDVLDVPLQERANWIRTHYEGQPVDVIEAWAGPDEHGYTDELKEAHERFAIDLLERRGYDIDDIDAFYSSEQYGEHMADALDATDRRVDQKRDAVSVSATDIRNGVASTDVYLNDHVNQSLTKRIAIVGGVSSGKTTLTKALADEYHTEWMPEHGREYWQEHADDDGLLTTDQLVELAEQHIQREDELAHDADEYLFVDTTPLTTLAWAKYYHGVEPSTLVLLSYMSTAVYDLHVLCDPHIDFEEDEGRDGEENRKRLHRMHKALMDEYGIDYIIVSGSVEERVQKVRDALDDSV